MKSLYNVTVETKAGTWETRGVIGETDELDPNWEKDPMDNAKKKAQAAFPEGKVRNIQFLGNVDIE